MGTYFYVITLTVPRGYTSDEKTATVDGTFSPAEGCTAHNMYQSIYHSVTTELNMSGANVLFYHVERNKLDMRGDEDPASQEGM